MSSTRAFVHGYLSEDPQSRDTSAGRVVELKVPTDGLTKDAPTMWWRISLWGKAGETALAHLRKGSEVNAFGRVGVSEWTGQDGTKRTTHEMRADGFEFCGKRGDAPQQQARPQEPRPQTGGSDWAARGEAQDTQQAWRDAERTRVQPRLVQRPPEQGDLGNPYGDDDVPF